MSAYQPDDELTPPTGLDAQPPAGAEQDPEWMAAVEGGEEAPLPPTAEPPPGVATEVEDPAAETQGPAPHVRGY